MPKLSFLQLTKIFGAGFVGYTVLVSVLSVGATVVFPDYLKKRFDMSLDMFLETMFIYFGLLGLVAMLLMLIGAWCILRLTRRRDLG